MATAKVTPIRANARKAAPRKPRSRKPVTLVSAVEDAVAAMPWLQPSDLALVQVARKYAAIIEADGDPAELAKRVGWIGPHLVNAIKALGGAPAERNALGVDREVRGRLAELRAARGNTAG